MGCKFRQVSRRVENACAFRLEFVDPKKYLIDSLVLEELSPLELRLLDSCINEYHRMEDDTVRIILLGAIVENMNHSKWIDYHLLMNDVVKSQIANSPEGKELLFYRRKLGEIEGNTGFITANRKKTRCKQLRSHSRRFLSEVWPFQNRKFPVL